MRSSLLATVIVPVCNKEKYLNQCFETLRHQTLSPSLFEVIFIDDGSTDSSLSMLNEFQNNHFWVTVISKENGGVCSARNTGLKAARGKYIFYLDPDDTFSENTLEDVTRFFNEIYDEVDLVTYQIVPFKNGKPQRLHLRYRVLTESGVYSINSDDGPLICQTTMNVCVKNEFECNTLFTLKDNKGKIFHEDQLYNTEILLKKQKIGYFDDAQYYWNINSESVSDDAIYPYYLFESTVTVFEKLFSKFDEEIPRYLQGLILNDFGWKMRRNALLPTHLYGDEYTKALNRLIALLRRVDIDLLMSYANLHVYHSFYFLNLISENRPLLKVEPGSLTLSLNGTSIWSDSSAEVILQRTRLSGNSLSIVGFIKSPAFLFFEGSVELWLIEKDNTNSATRQSVSLQDSSWSRCACKEIVAKFYSFRCVLDISKDRKYFFSVVMDGVQIGTFFSFMDDTIFSDKLGKCVLTQGKYISFQNQAQQLSVEKLTTKEFKRQKHNQISKLDKDVQLFRCLVGFTRKSIEKQNSQIWIYTDAGGKTDNAWIQFVHDSQINDGIRRYYAANRIDGLLKPTHSRNSRIISFGSRLHKVLYVSADKLICSDASRASYCPLGTKAKKYYSDLINAERIYLQHGVLWAHLPWMYSYDRLSFDYEVISSRFERDNLIRNYGFKRSDLIEAGMPRYDAIDSNKKPNKKILLCPSWRGYLIGGLTKNGREALTERFLGSDYYSGLHEFLNSPQLLELLNKYDYELHFKLHPVFEAYKDLFNLNSARISFAPPNYQESDYAVAITDYSSYSFDFVYLKRPIIYFIPDDQLFYAGLNHYNQLAVPLDEAFGEYVRSPQGVVDALERILKNDGKPLPKYSQKQEGFFFFYDNNQCDRIYRALSGR